MTILKHVSALVWMILLQATLIVAQQPSQQGEFLPIEQLPPEDQLPAAPLLIAAYSFVLVVLFLYIVSLARRLTSVQREMDRLDANIKQGGRA